MRKYKASVAAVSTDQITIQDQQATIQELEDERNRLREQLAELSSRLSCMEGENVSTAQHKRYPYQRHFNCTGSGNSFYEQEVSVPKSLIEHAQGTAPKNKR
jgi:hypothetical protein